MSRDLHRAVEAIPLGLILTDPAGTILYANPRATEVFRPDDDLIGRQLDDIVEQAAGEAGRRYLEEVRAGGDESAHRPLVHHRTGGGVTSNLQLSFTQVLGSTGSRDGGVLVILDSAASDRAADQLRHSEKLLALAALTGGVSHEFNNLFGMILGFSELLEDHVSPGGEAGDLLAGIGRAVDRGAHLVSQLESYARAEDGEPIDFDVEPVLKEVCRTLGPTLGPRIHLRIAVHRPLPWIHADLGQIRGAVVYLIENAALSYPDRKGDVQLSASTDADGYLVVEVSDAGVGMSPEVLRRCREPFFTTRDRPQSSGLGLALADSACAAASGELAISSREGQGTTVRIRLPARGIRARGPVDQAPAASTEAPPSRAYVVDDEPALVRLLTATLEGMGLQVESTTDPRGALPFLRDRADEFDLLVTDLTMPEVGGVDLAEAYRATRAQPGKVVAFTGSASADLVATTGDGLLFDRVLSKPIRRRQIVREIAEVLAAPMPSAET